MGHVSLSRIRETLELLYERYHRPAYRKEDPVEILWQYANPLDQEIAGIWAALFAWGRREVAIRKVQALLAALGDSPAASLRAHCPLVVEWRHRTWSPLDMSILWKRLGEIYRREGSLANFFWKRRTDWEEAIAQFQSEIGAPPLHRHIGNLRRGSASKRLLLWLRWMVRRDSIDPGPWEGFSPRWLYVPIDTHVSNWAVTHQLLSYRIPNWRTVLRLTEVFHKISPEDPLRYDFAIVTAGSRSKMRV
ncbi:MAG: DUF2400 domain-containing protein [Bacteroidia bacterium]|nr:DUF2400 domain-containing protein [Bacteroidia bacterium]